MTADCNLLFAVLALQADFVSREQFIDACTAWAADKATPIDVLMVRRGWLSAEEQADVERLVERKLKKHRGDVRRSLAEVAGADVRHSLAAIPDSDLRHSMAAGLPDQFVGLATLPPPPSSGPSRYTLSRVHATGGIGRVWLAQDTAMGRSVALKELRPERIGDSATAERFINEARITGQLEHPGIVPIYELGQRPQDSEPFYTMRFIRGRTLASAIQRFHDAKLPPPSSPALAFRELLTAFVGSCNAVAYAHSRGVIHRDLKPANIVLGDFGEVIVLDWGMAKVLPVGQDLNPAGAAQDRSPAPHGQSNTSEPPPRLEPPNSEAGQTVSGVVMGTPAYMPPEQAEGRHDLHDERSDVYALGAILYEILTGVIPFDAADTEQLLLKVRHEPPPLPRAQKRGVARALEAVCLKALAKRREDRYQSALVLADEVQHWLADEPVSCYAEPLPVRAGRWARRHRALVTTAAAVLLTTVMGLGVGLYFVNAEKNRTELARTTAEENEAISRAVLDFVENRVFAAARPKDQEGGQGYDVKLADAVRAALPYVEDSFTGQPLIEARLRMTLAESFRYLGKAEIAVEQNQRARALYSQQRGADHLDTLKSAHNLANSYIAAGRIQDAVKLNEETFQLIKGKLGPDHADTLRSMNNLAASYDAAGRTQEALKLCDETFQLRKTRLGPDHPDTLTSMNNLAASYGAVGRIQEALKLREETLQLRKAKLGPDHPDTLATMNNLALSYDAVGRTQEALKLREETLPLSKAKLGPDHPGTLILMNNLATSYDAIGRNQDALKLREETVELMKAKLGPDHPDTLKNMMNLATSYDIVGRIQDAFKLREETLQRSRAKLGPDHPSTLQSMGNLANSYEAAGRTRDALELREETLKLTQAKLGRDHPDTLTLLINLANSYSNAGRAQDALKLREEMFQVCKAKFGADHPSTLLSMQNLAASYIYLRRTSEALALVRQTLDLRQQRVHADPNNRVEQSFLALTYGYLGEAEQTGFNFAAAARAFSTSVELFNKVEQANALTPFWRDQFAVIRAHLEQCRKAEQAVSDLDFALKQPTAEVPGLLDLRVQALAAKKDQSGLATTAAAYSVLAAKDAGQAYNAGCAWSLLYGLASLPGADTAKRAEEYAGKALALLKQTPTGKDQFVATPAALAAHMKQDSDLDPLRQRDDFKKLLTDLEAKTPPKTATEGKR